MTRYHATVGVDIDPQEWADNYGSEPAEAAEQINTDLREWLAEMFKAPKWDGLASNVAVATGPPITTEDVRRALNQAADDILEALEAGDEGIRDVVNLMVNASFAYLTGAAQDLAGVVGDSYGEATTLEEVLEWCGR